MKHRKPLVTAALVLALALSAASTFAQDQAEMSPEQQEAMGKWMAYMAPGEPHKKLGERAGEWTFTTKMWEHPDAEPEESTGTSSSKMIMDGRYLIDRTEGTAMGMPFQGLGITGYDNLNQELVGIWIDSFGTGIMTSRGSCNDDWSVCKYVGESPDPMSGKNKKIKMVDRKIDADNFVFEMYDTTPEGKEFLTFQITYTRAE
jgi:hypothetical protein